MIGKGKHGRWATFGVRLYYIIGILYYIYSWFIIAGGIGVLTSLVGVYFSSSDFWWISLFAASLPVLIVGIGVWFSNWRARYKGINSGLKILASHSVYTIMPDGVFKYWRELEFVASIDGIDHFTHLFSWTGHGQILPSAGNGCHPELSDDPKSTRKRLRIYFERPHARRERFKIQYEMYMKDDSGAARPFLRTTLHEKIRRMKSEVVFDGVECPEKYKQVVYMSEVAEIPVSEEEVPVKRGECKLDWEVTKPRLGYNYCISW